jgi:hypothetical protein
MSATDDEAQPVKVRLERFGDPRNTWKWETGEVDYVARLGVAAGDVPELMTVAHEWIEPRTWPEDKDDMSGYAPIHAWRCLAQLRAVEAVGLLLEMMGPMDASGDDWYLEEFPHAFAWIGPASLAPLAGYLADAEQATFPRVCAAHALKEVAARHPQGRDEAVRALSDTLSRFQETDETLNAFAIGYLLDLAATESAETIERAFAADRVDVTVVGHWDSVRKELGVEGLGLVPKHLASWQADWLSSPEAKAERDAERVLSGKANPSLPPQPQSHPAPRRPSGSGDSRKLRRRKRKCERQNRRRSRRR